MLFTPKQNAELQSLPPPYIPGPYEYVTEVPPNTVPSLVSFALRALLADPDQIRLTVRLPLRHRRLLDELVPDPACLDPRLWAVLVQIYDRLPKYLRRIVLPLSDVHLPLLQSIASTSLFSLITVLSLPACVHLTDETVLQLKFLHSLTAFDASATSLSTYAIRSLAACLQLQSTDSTERRHRGPWQIRVLSLRDCKKMSNDGLSSLLSFPLLSAIDLRGTPCLPPKSFPFKPCPLPSQSLLHPATLSQSLQTLLDVQPDLYSSPYPYFISINTLYHPPSTTRPLRPSVAPQDAFVTIPSSKAPIKVSSAILLEKQIQEREGALAHERNKDAWYERQDRLDYDIIHTRKIRPRAGSNLSAFKSSLSSSSKPFASLTPRPVRPPSLASRNQNIMGPVPRSSFPPQNRVTDRPSLHTNANTVRQATAINANTSLSYHAHPHLVPAPAPAPQTQIQPHIRSTSLNPTSPTLTPAFTYNDKAHGNTYYASRPNSSAAAAENRAACHSLSVPNPEHSSASDHAVSPHHHRGFQSESQHTTRQDRERGVIRDREGKEEGEWGSGQRTRGLLSEHTPTPMDMDMATSSSSSSSFSTFCLVNDLPSTNARSRSSTMDEDIPNTSNGRRHFPTVTGNQEHPLVVRTPRVSVIGRRDGEAAADEDEDDDAIPALSSSSRTHGTHRQYHRSHHQHDLSSSFSRPSQLSTIGAQSHRINNAIGKTRNPYPHSGPPSESTSGHQPVPHPDAFDNDYEYEYESENHLRLYRPPPPWSALTDALNVRHAEEVERERRITGYPVPLPPSSSSPSGLSGAGSGGGGRGGGLGGEIAKVDMMSERAARVKRELDAVVQAAAKRRRLDMDSVLPVAGIDIIDREGGRALTRSVMEALSLSASSGSGSGSSGAGRGGGNNVRCQPQPSPLPLVNESTTRNPFRRKHLASGPMKYSTPPLLSRASAVPASAREEIQENVNVAEDEDGGDEDDIVDDENEYSKANKSNDNDNERDAGHDDYDDTKHRTDSSTSKSGRSMSAVAVEASSSVHKGKGTGMTKQKMAPISSVKVPILPSNIREEALARERKESLGGAGTGAGARSTPKGGSSTSTKTKTKQGQGQGSGQAKFDWKSWGGGPSASSSMR